MKDEDRLKQMLETIQNDSVVVSRLLLKYDSEGEIMSVLGAVFSTWCDAYKVPLSDRKRMLRRLLELQGNVESK